MGFGERLRYFRIKRGMTQKMLGQKMGFPEKSADIRIAQYENGSRNPKWDVLEAFADVLDIHTCALCVPNMDSFIGLLHTLFAMEDLFGIRIGTVDDEPVLFVNEYDGKNARELRTLLLSWAKQADKLAEKEITREEYDRWRYGYPMYEDPDAMVQFPPENCSSAVQALFQEKVKKRFQVEHKDYPEPK